MLEELNRRIQSAIPKTRWLPDDGKALAPGQVWTVAGGCGDQPAWMWLILELLDGGMVNAAPTFPWGELAGPQDVFVPEDWAGAALVVSFELEATVSPSAFGRCEGRLPERAVDFILRARTDRRDTTRRNAYNWGWEYLDEIDRRLAYHLEIAGTIERLQGSVRDVVYVPEINESDGEDGGIRFRVGEDGPTVELISRQMGIEFRGRVPSRGWGEGFVVRELGLSPYRVRKLAEKHFPQLLPPVKTWLAARG